MKPSYFLIRARFSGTLFCPSDTFDRSEGIYRPEPGQEGFLIEVAEGGEARSRMNSAPELIARCLQRRSQG